MAERVLVVLIGTETEVRVLEVGDDGEGPRQIGDVATERLKQGSVPESSYNVYFGTDFQRLAMLCFRLTVHNKPRCIVLVVDARIDNYERIISSEVIPPWWFGREIVNRLSQQLGGIKVVLCTLAEAYVGGKDASHAAARMVLAEIADSDPDPE